MRFLERDLLAGRTELVKPRYTGRKKKIIIDNYSFDSKKESEVYLDLRDKKRKGYILDLEVHPKFLLQEGFKTKNGERIRPIHYVADFLVIHTDDSREVLEVKGMRRGKPLVTPDGKLKLKLFRFQYPDLKFKIV